MSTNEAKKIVRKYAEKLRTEKFPFFAVYLFGSQVKGNAYHDSDIDIAVFSDAIGGRNNLNNNLKLWKLRRGIDLRIDPHGFSADNFLDEADPMVYEIKTTGIKIA